MTERCPERDAGQSHEFDSGECCYCSAAEPPPPTGEDAHLEAMYDDAQSMSEAFASGEDAAW